MIASSVSMPVHTPRFGAGSLNALSARPYKILPGPDLDHPDFVRYIRSEFLPGVPINMVLEAVDEGNHRGMTVDKFHTHCFKSYELYQALKGLGSMIEKGLVAQGSVSRHNPEQTYRLTELGREALRKYPVFNQEPESQPSQAERKHQWPSDMYRYSDYP